MFCSRCGTTVREGDPFCGNCGTAVGTTVAQPVVPQPLAAQPLAAQPLADGPVPPDMNWVVVLVLCIVTFGLFGLIWMIRQAFFVKKIDPSSNAVPFAVCASICLMIYGVFSAAAGLVAGVNPDSDSVGIFEGFAKIFAPLGGLFCILMVVRMIKSLTWYYNNVEPIGLRLNTLAALVFGSLYFQYHFSNIAAWKKDVAAWKRGQQQPETQQHLARA